jgi:CTP-dependent riboflavin kinase
VAKFFVDRLVREPDTIERFLEGKPFDGTLNLSILQNMQSLNAAIPRRDPSQK